jgi:hypothetical protein
MNGAIAVWLKQIDAELKEKEDLSPMKEGSGRPGGVRVGHRRIIPKGWTGDLCALWQIFRENMSRRRRSCSKESQAPLSGIFAL